MLLVLVAVLLFSKFGLDLDFTFLLLSTPIVVLRRVVDKNGGNPTFPRLSFFFGLCPDEFKSTVSVCDLRPESGVSETTFNCGELGLDFPFN